MAYSPFGTQPELTRVLKYCTTSNCASSSRKKPTNPVRNRGSFRQRTTNEVAKKIGGRSKLIAMYGRRMMGGKCD